MVINGKQTLVPIQVSGTSRINDDRIDSNKVATVHGDFDTFNRLTYAIENDSDENVSVYYVNREKTIEALSNAENPILGSPDTYNGYIHNIAESSSPVKHGVESIFKTRQFKHWFKDSAVTDSIGNPLVVYHGSDENITEFDPSKIRAVDYDAPWLSCQSPSVK